MRTTSWTAAMLLAGAAAFSGAAMAADGDRMQSFDTWSNDYATHHEGRISRQAYLDEMGRRFDAMDREHRGLTPAEVSNLTHRVDSNAPAPLSGAGVQPGNMGPGNSRGQ